jgi:transposase
LIDTRIDTISNIAFYNYIDPDNLSRSYKEHLSGYSTWEHKEHASEYLLYSKNIGERISIDEVSLSDGELYTIVTNKSAKGKKGALISILNGTKVEEIEAVLMKIPVENRIKVKEVTLDMAKNMESASGKCFPNASLVTDRFHVVRLVSDALQHVRIKYRWEAIKSENESIKEARENHTTYTPEVFANGDTRKQLLARSRYLLFKTPSSWHKNQQIRADILFKEYPILKQAYNLSMHFRGIYNCQDKNTARIKMVQWIEDTVKSGIDEYNTAANSIKINLENILNFFHHRSTNANAESFNSKLKGFRAIQRGVKDIDFFLFRLEKLFA